MEGRKERKQERKEERNQAEFFFFFSSSSSSSSSEEETGNSRRCCLADDRFGANLEGRETIATYWLANRTENLITNKDERISVSATVRKSELQGREKLDGEQQISVRAYADTQRIGER
jgi:hypothetical protein